MSAVDPLSRILLDIDIGYKAMSAVDPPLSLVSELIVLV